MSLQFACPSCGKKLQADDSHAGSESQCPKCQALFTIPAPPQREQGPSPSSAGLEYAAESGNPYQSPGRDDGMTPLDEAPPLASLEQRLLAAVLDNTIVPVFVVSSFIITVFVIFPKQIEEQPLAALLVGFLLVLALQSILLAWRGQTIGKMVFKSKIVGLDSNQHAGFIRTVLLRYVLRFIVFGIPFVGALFMIADPLTIIRADRRCLHDFMAGTKVIRVGKYNDVLKLRRDRTG